MLDRFAQIWLVDFEYRAPSGERPVPRCMVAREYRTGRLLRTWLDGEHTAPPFNLPKDSLMVAYSAPGDLQCFLDMGWPLPRRLLDLYVEFRVHTNGRFPPKNTGLLSALGFFGLDTIGAREKSDMRALAMRDGAYTIEEQQALLDYCQTDIDSLTSLLPHLLPKSDVEIGRAVHRGKYMCTVARMEHAGIPIDVPMLGTLRDNWELIQAELIARTDRDFGCFDGLHFQVRSLPSLPSQTWNALAADQVWPAGIR